MQHYHLLAPQGITLGVWCLTWVLGHKHNTYGVIEKKRLFSLSIKTTDLLLGKSLPIIKQRDNSGSLKCKMISHKCYIFVSEGTGSAHVPNYFLVNMHK